MNITIRFTALSKIAAAIACVSGIPIKFAEKTLIASPIPRFPGVIATIIERFVIAAMNNACVRVKLMLNI